MSNDSVPVATTRKETAMIEDAARVLAMIATPIYVGLCQQGLNERESTMRRAIAEANLLYDLCEEDARRQLQALTGK